MRFHRITIAGALLGSIALPAGIARAAGSEVLPGGNLSVARGGAVAARAEDPMVLSNDPAGLALLPGSQILFEEHLVIPHLCVDPYGYYGWGAYGNTPSEFGDPLAVDNPQNPTIGATYATTPLPKVCNSGKLTPLPNLVWTMRVSKEFGVGAGFAAPVLMPGLQFGAADGTISTPSGPRPTPTRYSLVKQEVTFGLDPTVGAAYRPIRQLSFGMQLQVLMVKAKATAVQNSVSGTQPSSDWLATLETKDYFIPSVTFSVHAKPIRPVDLVVALKYTENFNGSGNVTFQTGTFHHGATSGQVPYDNAPIPIKNVQVGMPWKLTAGARYAGLLTKSKEEGLLDPMDTELWDVEVDASAELDGLARNSVDVGGDATVKTRVYGKATSSLAVENVGVTTIDPHRNTAYDLRLGGSYSVLPRRLQVHAGTFYESRSVDPAFADIDTFAFQRIGLGLGGVVRLGSFDIRVGYSHVFSETLDVAPPPHQNLENARPGDPRSGFDQRVGGSFGPDGTRRGGTVLPDGPSGSPDAVAKKTQVAAIATAAKPPRVINAGKYTAALDVISLGVVYHF